MTLKRRLMALENVRGDPGRFIVAIGPDAFDHHELMRERGIVIAAADTVVLIRKPAGSAMSVSVDGRAC